MTICLAFSQRLVILIVVTAAYLIDLGPERVFERVRVWLGVLPEVGHLLEPVSVLLFLLQLVKRVLHCVIELILTDLGVRAFLKIWTSLKGGKTTSQENRTLAAKSML